VPHGTVGFTSHAKNVTAVKLVESPSENQGAYFSRLLREVGAAKQ
jgi:hypothetical protein